MSWAIILVWALLVALYGHYPQMVGVLTTLLGLFTIFIVTSKDKGDS